MKRVVPGTIAALLLGSLLGYVGAYVEYRNEKVHGASYPQWKGEWICLFGLPGKIISQKQKSYDYRLTEAWILDRHKIALWNGIIYGLLGLTVLSLTTRRKKGIEPGGPLRSIQ